MKFVLDANIAVQWVLNETGSPMARNLRAEFRAQVHELVAPDIFVVECSHALTRAERQRIIQVGDAAVLLADILATPPRLVSFLPLIPRAIEISSTIRIGVYDCCYVALAEQEICELVTADARLVASLPGFPVVELSRLP